MPQKKPSKTPQAQSASQTAPEQVIYELPLNERTRTLLRLEFLFNQMRAHTYRHSVWDSRAALNTLFDIVNLFSRSDLKTEMMKELERQANFLDRLSDNPLVDDKRLEAILAEVDTLIDRLHSVHNQSLDIRQNELLSSVKQRNNIGGGCCGFDLPAYHYWLSQPEEKRILDLQTWFEPFEPLQQATHTILRLIRESGQTSHETAHSGFFQKTLEANPATQLIRIILPPDAPYYAEISGGKHRFTVRFMEPHANERPSQAGSEIAFQLSCCAL